MLEGGCQQNAVELLGFQGNRAGAPHPKLSQSEVPGIHGPTGPRRMPAGEEQGLVSPWLDPQDMTDHSAQLSRSQVASRHQAAAASHRPLHH